MVSKKNKKLITFQDTILNLQKYWSKNGCLVLQPYDIEVGAGTFHPATHFDLSERKNGKPRMFSLQDVHQMDDMEKIQIDFNITINFK